MAAPTEWLFVGDQSASERHKCENQAIPKCVHHSFKKCMDACVSILREPKFFPMSPVFVRLERTAFAPGLSPVGTVLKASPIFLSPAELQTFFPFCRQSLSMLAFRGNCFGRARFHIPPIRGVAGLEDNHCSRWPGIW